MSSISPGAKPGGHRPALAPPVTVIRPGSRGSGGPIAPQQAGQPGNFRLIHAAVECLQAAGIEVSMAQAIANPADIMAQAITHSTSDFPGVVGNFFWTFVRRQYEQLPPWIRAAGRKVDAPDFRDVVMANLGELELSKVPETGEVEHATIPEAKEKFRLATYGKIFTLTRQLYTNDADGSVMAAATNQGRAVNNLEANLSTDLLVSNGGAGPVMDDGTVCFHADHGNTGVEVLGESGLSTAQKSLRQQKALDGKSPINAAPRFLLVPSALETTGLKTLAVIQPAKSEDANPFAGKLDLLVEPRLDAVSETAWYLIADPAQIDCLVYANLRGRSGPSVEVRPGWEQDGMGIRVLHDFAAAIVDWRGIYRSTGAGS